MGGNTLVWNCVCKRVGKVLRLMHLNMSLEHVFSLFRDLQFWIELSFAVNRIRKLSKKKYASYEQYYNSAVQKQIRANTFVNIFGWNIVARGKKRIEAQFLEVWYGLWSILSQTIV